MRVWVLLGISVSLTSACNRAGESRKADSQSTAEEAVAPAEEQPAPDQPPTGSDQASNKVEAAEPGDPVPSFQLTGLALSSDEPAEVTLSSTDRERPTAYVFVGTTCKTTARYLDRMAKLEKAYADKVDFVYLYPNRSDSPEAIQAFHEQHELTGPLFVDEGAQVAALLGRKRTAEVVVVGANDTIVYAGAIDDNKDESAVTRKHLAIALDEHLAGKPVSHPKTLGTA